ncbi:MAG: hypothetical protein JWN15_4145 [Firmicutes bacterium]|nr:hypothetical protein [Bacillota bacterium]
MRKVLLVAGFTLREALRRRFLLILAAAAVVVLALFGLVISRAWPETLRHLTPVQARAGIWLGARIFLGALNILAAIAAIFLAAGGIGPEVENGSMHLLLTRTVSRAQVFLGKLLATASLAGLFSLFLAAGVGLSLVLAGPGWPPGWHYVLLIFPVGPILLAAFALGLSTRLGTIGTGITTLMLFVVAQVGTMLETLGNVSGSSTLMNTGIVISLLSPIDAVYRWMIYRWTDGIGVVGALMRSTGMEAPAPSVWMLVWAAGWLVVVILVGTRSFRTRDL